MKLFLSILVASSFSSCMGFQLISDKSEKSKDFTTGAAVFEIWKNVNGSVGIEGKSLLFRLNDDGSVEFDQEIRTNLDDGPPHVGFSIRRIGPYPLSEEELVSLNEVLRDLFENRFNKSYKALNPPFDVNAKFTLLYKKDDIDKKIVIYENNHSVIDTSVPERFPESLSVVVTTVYSLRNRLLDSKRK